MTFPVARIGDNCTHGAVIITGASTQYTNGIPVARIGDLVDCPIHGVNPIVSVLPNHISEGAGLAHIGGIASCGAVIITGSADHVRD